METWGRGQPDEHITLTTLSVNPWFILTPGGRSTGQLPRDAAYALVGDGDLANVPHPEGSGLWRALCTYADDGHRSVDQPGFAP
jgi:hypothetical protein